MQHFLLYLENAKEEDVICLKTVLRREQKPLIPLFTGMGAKLDRVNCRITVTRKNTKGQRVSE